MLRCDAGRVEIKGKYVDLCSELAVLIRNLVKCGALDKEDVMNCVELGLMSEAELEEKLSDVKEHARDTFKELDELREFLKDFLGE